MHGWTQESLERMLQDWEKTPEHMTALSLKVRTGAGATYHMDTKHIERKRSTMRRPTCYLCCRGAEEA